MLDFIASIHPTLSGTLGFCLGTLVGMRISLALARRAEFVVAAKELRKKLVAAQAIEHWPVYVPTEVEIDWLSQYLGPIKRRRLRAAVEAHRESYRSHTEQGPAGELSLRDPGAVAATIEPMLRLVRVF